jgi:hypothetical protein
MWQTFPCYRCGAPNYMGQRFCNNCGAPLIPTCPYCGAEVDPAGRFCSNCGAPQSAPPMPQQMPVRSPDIIDNIQIWLQNAFRRITSLSTNTYLIILLCGIVIAIGGVLYWQFGPGIKQPDTNAPYISNVTTTAIGKYSATIMWYTDEPASSQVEYGLSSSYGLTTPAQPQNDPTQGYEGVTQHTVILSRLPSNKTHHFRVKSIDKDGNETVSGDYTFKTDAVEDFFVPAD